MMQLFVIKLTLENEDDGLFIPQHERSHSPHSPMPLLTPTKQPSPVLVSGFNTLSTFIIIIVSCFGDLNTNSNSHYPQENKSLSTLCFFSMKVTMLNIYTYRTMYFLQEMEA